MSNEPTTTIVEPHDNSGPIATRATLVPESSVWLQIIERAVESGKDISQLGQLLDLQQKWEAEQARKAFVAAFAAFKAEAPTNIGRGGTVDFTSQKGRTNYNYVKLDAAADALVPILSRHGLAHSWDTQQTQQGITVTCHIEHVAGYSRAVTLTAMPDTSGNKNAVQAIGSTITYLQRYTFLSALGIAQGDMDNDGSGGGPVVITDDQVGELNDLIVSTGTNLTRFLEWAEVTALDAMPSDKFTKAIDFLQQKRRKQKPAAPAQAEPREPGAEG